MNLRTKQSLAGILAIGLMFVFSPIDPVELYLPFPRSAGIAAIVRIPYIRVLTITDDFLYATTYASLCLRRTYYL